MAIIINIMTLLLLLPALLAALYYAALAIISLRTRNDNFINAKESQATTTFAIIIPTYNEEQSIQQTISSCKALDYPENKYSIYVIADNCTDNTASLANSENVHCLVRSDTQHIGKGYAVAWGLEQIATKEHDAYLIIDADCQVQPQSLKIFDIYLCQGFETLQSKCISNNPDESATSYAVSVGNFIENELYYSAKDIIGLPISLRGTGMVFGRKLLSRHPWSTSSIVEDTEFTIRLIKNKETIKFVKEVAVKTSYPVNQDELNVQRSRWAGSIAIGKSLAFKLIIDGIRKKSIQLLDSGWSFLVLSRPLILLELFACLICAYLGKLIIDNEFSQILFQTSIIILIIQSCYFSIGIYLLGVNIQRLRFILTTPLIISHLIFITFRGIMKFETQKWLRTPRRK